MSVTCPDGHANTDGSAFCNQCGKPIAPDLEAQSQPATKEDARASEGRSEPHALGSQTPPRYRFYAIVSGIAVLVIVVAVILAISIIGAVSSAQEQAASEAAESARLQLLSDAVSECGVSATVVQDEGRSAFLDNAGEDFGSGDLSVTDLFCVLEGLDTPDAVINHMSQTRSLDGTQSDTWNEFSATWTYHPDDGLDIIIKLADP